MKSDSLHNMAPNAKRSFVVSIALAVIGIGLYFFAVEPAEASLKSEKKRLAELSEKQKQMGTNIRSARKVQENTENAEQTLALYQKAMLEPLLGSYSMQAKAKIEPLMLGAGLAEFEYAEEPARALPLPNPMPKQLHKRVAIRITAKGSYQSAASFLLRLEKEMPLVSLQSLQITTRQDPTKQIVSFVLEWPAKGGTTSK